MCTTWRMAVAVVESAVVTEGILPRMETLDLGGPCGRHSSGRSANAFFVALYQSRDFLG